MAALHATVRAACSARQNCCAQIKRKEDSVPQDWRVRAKTPDAKQRACECFTFDARCDGAGAWALDVDEARGGAGLFSVGMSCN
jgi:hypothetical protein